MRARVAKWGKSLAVRIPLTFAKQAGLADGSAVTLTFEHGRLVLNRSVPTLAELVADITPQNRREKMGWGSPRGRETW